MRRNELLRSQSLQEGAVVHPREAKQTMNTATEKKRYQQPSKKLISLYRKDKPEMETILQCKLKQLIPVLKGETWCTEERKYMQTKQFFFALI